MAGDCEAEGFASHGRRSVEPLCCELEPDGGRQEAGDDKDTLCLDISTGSLTQNSHCVSS